MINPEPPWIWPRAAYLHVPFCAHHCGYCDFAVAVGHDEQMDLYLEALAHEMEELAGKVTVDTIYVGGGTPSHLSTGQLERLTNLIAQKLELAPGGEFSLEANPDSLTGEKLHVLKDHGLTRISLGAQSFHESTLHTLERRHDPHAVAVAVGEIRGHGLDLSLDLIFAVPGQSISDWEQDVRRALALEPDHLSTYGLTFEKGTRLWHEKKQGHIRPLSENIELAMYSKTIDLLEAAGFEHYEISSFAREGKRCRHNLNYWANFAHFGFGMGAASYLRGRRQLNTRSLAEYLERVMGGRSAAIQSEELEQRDRALETLAVQLRRSEGVKAKAFAEQTGMDLAELAGPTVASLVELGLIEVNDDGIRLTRQGKYVADAVIEEFMKLAVVQGSRT